MQEETQETQENEPIDIEDVHFEENSSSKTETHVKDKKKGKKDAKIEEELLECNQKVADLNDKYLRLFSDFDNFRKRKSLEIIEIRKTAAEDLILSLLNVVDDFERAITLLSNLEQKDAFEEGTMLIYNKLINILKQQGLEEIDALQQDFNTDFHEAITNIPVDDDMKGKVFDVVQKGYLLNGKVIRFAKVVVGS